MWRALLFLVMLSAALRSEDKQVDSSVLKRIQSAAFQDSKVMDHLFYLTDVYGPRLTNSPQFRAAAQWAMNRLMEYGLENVHVEHWGPFGPSWRLERFSAHMIEPGYQTLTGVPLAWTPGTDGVVSGQPVIISEQGDLERHRGKLKGRIVLTMNPGRLSSSSEPLSHRLSNEELSAWQDTSSAAGSATANRWGTQGPPSAEQRAAFAFQNKVWRFLKEEGAALAVQYAPGGDGGVAFAESAGISWQINGPPRTPTVVLTQEHYNRIFRLVEHGIPVKLEFDIRVASLAHPDGPFNVVAEITGGAKKQEVVMVGAHLDSWHGATGATDNAAGCAIAIEAVRILGALNLNLPRPIRVVLWDGEEQGALGSQAYVLRHFGSDETMRQSPEYRNLSAYYNNDKGAGRIRGIMATGNAKVRPLFESWMGAVRSLGVSAVVDTDASLQAGGSDQRSFLRAGIPAFMFVQDPLDYRSRTHHSNMDFYDRVHPDDLMQAAAVEAWFLYKTAVEPELMPRSVVPAPR